MSITLDVLDNNSSLLKSIPESSSGECQLTLREDAAVSFRVELQKEAFDVVLYITDIPLEPNREYILNESVHCFQWTPVGQNGFFQNIYGECQLRLTYQLNSHDIYEHVFCPINIVGSKLSEDHIKMMIDYLSDRSPQSIWAPRAATRLETSFEKTSHDCLEFFREAQLGEEVLKSVMPYILAKPCSMLVPRTKVEPAKAESVYSYTSIDWLLSHLDILEPSYATPENLNLHWSYFKPKELEVEELFENCIVYENKAIYAYISSLISFLIDFLGKFRDDNIYEEELDIYGRLPLFLILKRENKKLYSTYIKRADKLIDKLCEFKRLFEDKLGINVGNFDPPTFTPKVRTNIYYRSIFERLAAWHALGSPNWDSLLSFSGVKSIDQIYENYCFHKLIEALDANGFTTKYDYIDEEVKCSEYSHHENKNFCVKLYYEREFHPQEYATYDDYYNIERWNSSVKKRNPHHAYSKRIPDFTLVVSKKDKPSSSTLIIFDAKYTTHNFALKKYLPECVMKYVHGIASHTGGRSPVVIFYIMFAGCDDIHNISQAALHYADENYDIYSNSAQIPCIGAIEVSPRERLSFKSFLGRSIELAISQLD